MTAARGYLPALACAVVLGACAHAPVEPWPARQVEDWTKVCTLEMAEPEVAAGAPVRLRFTLFNHDFTTLVPQDTHVILFTAVDTPLRGLHADLFAVERDGEPVPYRGEVAKQPDFDRCDTRAGCVLGDDDYLWIRSEQKLSAEVDLAAAYAFDRPGTYTIRYKARLHDIRYLRFRSLRVFASPSGPVPHRQELQPADPGCNTVTVTVRPR